DFHPVGADEGRGLVERIGFPHRDEAIFPVRLQRRDMSAVRGQRKAGERGESSHLFDRGRAWRGGTKRLHQETGKDGRRSREDAFHDGVPSRFQNGFENTASLPVKEKPPLREWRLSCCRKFRWCVRTTWSR